MKAIGQFRELYLIIITIVLLVFVASLKVNYAQEDVIRIDTNLVAIPATVLDRDGRYAAGLKKEDFQIFENGIEQDIALFEPTDQPVTVFMLLDVSGSMSYHLLEMANASSVLIKQLRPDDQFLAAGFGEDIKMLFQATKVKDLPKGVKLQPMSTFIDTMVYDAVEFALKKTKKIRGRKAIILFSDGVGSGLSASAKSNLRDAEEHEAVIYTVQFAFSPPTPPRYINKKRFQKWSEKATGYLQQLAEKTGGRHYLIEDISDLGKTFGAIADELGRQYSLGYYPKIEAKEKREVRQIKVKLKQPNLVVRARESYVIEPNK
jgi:VWFA-related protein